MNVSSINSYSNTQITRPRVPRNNVSFSGSVPPEVEQTAKETYKGVKGFFKGIGSSIANGAKTAGTSIKEGAQNAGNATCEIMRNTKKVITETAQDTVKYAKGSKENKIKLAVLGVTTLLTTGFALKEIHDIITKSNPDRKA